MFPLTMAHVVYIKYKGVQWIHEQYTLEEDDDWLVLESEITVFLEL